MLSAAKHLCAQRDRCFAALSMTPCDCSHGQGLFFTIEPCLKLIKPTHRSPVLPPDAHSTDGNGHLRGRRSSHLHGFEDGSDALTSADAHGDQRILATGAAQFVERLHRQDTARRPDGMPKRDPAAVGVGAIQRQV
jgi:hypothetical protein